MTETTKNRSCSSQSSSTSIEDSSTTATLDGSYSDHNIDADESDDNSFCKSAPTTVTATTSALRRRHKSGRHSLSSSTTTTPLATIQISKKEQRKDDNKNNPFLLFICASGICTCYLYYGMIQEKLFSKNSSDSAMKKCGNTTTFMLLLSCMTNVIVSYILIWIEHVYQSSAEKFQKGSGVDVGRLNHKLFLQSSFCYFVAMTASNESLAHVSYPTAVLAKSSKLIPTMVVGFFIEHKSFLVKEWLSAALITSGIIGFNLSRMNQQQQGGDAKNEREDSIYGLCLLVLSLMADGVLASCQNCLKKDEQPKQKQQHQCRKPTALETMLWINAYAIIFLLPLSIWSGQFSNGIQLVNLPNPAAHSLPSSSPMSIRATILMLNLTAATGQIFIFFTIQLFSPLMCTTITTTRKFLTILLSVWKYGHKFNATQWMSIGMVFGGLYLGIVSKFVNSGGKTTSSKCGKVNKNYQEKVETDVVNDGNKGIKAKVE